MRISDRYIGKQVLTGTLYAVMVLGIVLVLGKLFKEIQPLLVDQKAPLRLVGMLVLNMLPLSLMYTIPWGFLSAVLVVFGRLSVGQEITGFRVAGVSLGRLSAPVFVIGAGLSLFSLWMNVEVVPHSRASFVQLVYDQAQRDPESLLKPGVVQGSLSDNGGDALKLLVEGKSNGWVDGFHCYVLPDREKSLEQTYIYAAHAALSVDQAKSQLKIRLRDAYFEKSDDKGKMSTVFAQEAEPLVIDLKKPRRPRANAMTNAQIQHQLDTDKGMTREQRVRMYVELMTRYSLSMACFSFAFVAVPLGLQSRRRDTSWGMVYSLLIGTGYFLCVMLADHFRTDRGALAMLWAPNVACILLGFILFRRARFK